MKTINKQKGSIDMFELTCIVLGSLFLIGMMYSDYQNGLTDRARFDTCIEALYKTGIDVNDDKGRAEYLKECMDR